MFVSKRNPRTRSIAGLILTCFMLGFVTDPAPAHETDQYTVPTGRQYADLRFWLSEYMYDRLEAAVGKTNDRIRSSLRDGMPTAATSRNQSPDALARAVLLEFPPVINYTEILEMQLKSSRVRSQFPGLLVSYLPPQWIYHHPMLLLDPTKLPRLGRSSTLMVNGTYLGTDKIVHFIHMGYIYYRTYQKAIERGLSTQEATARAVNEGAGSGFFSEKGMLGFLPTGVVSNGDKAADYVGMKFYQNLTQPVMLKGSMHPPLLMRKGEIYVFNSHVRRGSDFFSVFISDHYDEALNPNTYAPGQSRWVADEVRKRCPAVLAWYRDPSGRPYTQDDYRRIIDEHSTYYGEDYGHEGDTEEMVSILTVCFDPQEPALLAHHPVAAEKSFDALGRSALWRSAREGKLGEVERLIVAADINNADIDGETVVHAAVRGGNVAVLRALLRAGANLNAANKTGLTPLHLAVQTDAVEAVQVLLATGCDAIAQDDFGCTPLHDAARRGSAEVITMLLRAGGEPQIADNFGTTPLHRAARAGRLRAAQLLLEAGADPTAVNSFGKSPIDEARAARNDEMAQLLAQRPLQREPITRGRPVPVPLVSYPTRP